MDDPEGGMACPDLGWPLGRCGQGQCQAAECVCEHGWAKSAFKRSIEEVAICTVKVQAYQAVIGLLWYTAFAACFLVVINNLWFFCMGRGKKRQSYWKRAAPRLCLVLASGLTMHWCSSRETTLQEQTASEIILDFATDPTSYTIASLYVAVLEFVTVYQMEKCIWTVFEICTLKVEQTISGQKLNKKIKLLILTCKIARVIVALEMVCFVSITSILNHPLSLVYFVGSRLFGFILMSVLFLVCFNLLITEANAYKDSVDCANQLDVALKRVKKVRRICLVTYFSGSFLFALLLIVPTLLRLFEFIIIIPGNFFIFTAILLLQIDSGRRKWRKIYTTIMDEKRESALNENKVAPRGALETKPQPEPSDSRW